MRIEKMTLRDWDKVKATFNVVTEENITIYNFKVIEGQKGLFVGLPSRGSNGKYFDSVWMSDEMKAKLTDQAIAVFNDSNGNDDDDDDDPII
jgi:DNA-binding cell septation regulator SpoVG